MGIDGNEAPEQLAKQGSLLPLTGPGLALGIPTKVAWEVIEAGRAGNTMGIGCLYVDKGKLRAFLQDTLLLRQFTKPGDC
jgi:hypothetical protein